MPFTKEDWAMLKQIKAQREREGVGVLSPQTTTSAPSPPPSLKIDSLDLIRRKLEKLAEIKVLQDFISGKPNPLQQDNSTDKALEIFQTVMDMRDQIKEEVYDSIGEEEESGGSMSDQILTTLVEKMSIGQQTELNPPIVETASPPPPPIVLPYKDPKELTRNAKSDK